MPASAAKRWAADLAEWAIPPEILARATASPWEFPPGVFERRADRARDERSPSTDVARAALPSRGRVLDVGCGAGAASLPLASAASLLAGVDVDARSLGEFRTRAEATGAQTVVIEGRWPDVAGRAPIVDVVVCHHVAYNVPDLPAFARALTDHATARVVLELTAVHPRAYLNPLWLHFHNLPRPSRPTVDDAVAVLEETDLPVQRIDWIPQVPGTWFASVDEAVAWTARALCLTAEHHAELRRQIEPELLFIDGMVAQRPRPRATLWWDGAASAAQSPRPWSPPP